MKAPRFATLTISLDTERWRERPQFQRDGDFYILNRLLSGEPVADSELEFRGLKVSAREAVSAEILPRP